MRIPEVKDRFERLKLYGSIAGYALLIVGWVFSAVVAGYGLFTHQGDDFYNHSPWGFIAFPGYFLLFGAILSAMWGLGILGWRLIVLLGGWTQSAGDVRMAWLTTASAPRSKRESQVLQVVAWTTGLVGALLLLWGDPFLPSGTIRLPVIVGLTVGAGVLLLRVWTGWQRNPYGLGRVSAGVAAGILIAMAYRDATLPTHSQCVNGVGGRDPECFEYAEVPGPDIGSAAMWLVGAGFVVVVASTTLTAGTSADE
jgi:hypothetical protein